MCAFPGGVPPPSTGAEAGAGKPRRGRGGPRCVPPPLLTPEPRLASPLLAEPPEPRRASLPPRPPPAGLWLPSEGNALRRLLPAPAGCRRDGRPGPRPEGRKEGMKEGRDPAERPQRLSAARPNPPPKAEPAPPFSKTLACSWPIRHGQTPPAPSAHPRLPSASYPAPPSHPFPPPPLPAAPGARGRGRRGGSESCRGWGRPSRRPPVEGFHTSVPRRRRPFSEPVLLVLGQVERVSLSEKTFWGVSSNWRIDAVVKGDFVTARGRLRGRRGVCPAVLPETLPRVCVLFLPANKPPAHPGL